MILQPRTQQVKVAAQAVNDMSSAFTRRRLAGITWSSHLSASIVFSGCCMRVRGERPVARCPTSFQTNPLPPIKLTFNCYWTT